MTKGTVFSEKNQDISETKPSALIDGETSGRITSLRYILSVLVVFIHNNFTAEKLADSLAEGNRIPVFVQSAAGEWIQFVISSGFGSCAVPLFFMFSAYLFFKKNMSYKVMLKKKAKGLLLPYFVWIALNIALVTFGKLFAARLNLSLLGNPEKIPVLTWGVLDWLKAFSGFGFDKYNHPYVGQFWFVRDLLILFLISPVLRIVYRRFPKTSLIFCVFVYISGVTPQCFESDRAALLFFTLGYFWAERDFSPFAFADSFRWTELLAMFAFSSLGCNLIFKGNSVCSALMVLFSALIFLKLSGLISRNKKIFDFAEKISPFSFFLFAVHMPFLLACVQNLWLRFLPMKNPAFCQLEYFGANIVIVALGTFAGFILRKICPPLFSILNGGRG